MSRANHGDKTVMIEKLKERGSYLTMNWAEDDDCWEVDFITGGERVRATSKFLDVALRQIYQKSLNIEDAKKTSSDRSMIFPVSDVMPGTVPLDAKPGELFEMNPDGSIGAKITQ
jgi:hypothetical protein